MPRILISGITGFLGSHIATKLIASDIEVIGLKRKNSNIWRCREIENDIFWINLDDSKSFEKISSIPVDVFIHSAWIGVEANDRNNLGLQNQNIDFFNKVLQVLNLNNLSKIIVLGSQAEYGRKEGIIEESDKCETLLAYGKAKLACLNLLKDFTNKNNMTWIWLRIFSIFGEKQGKSWLIPHLIDTITTEEQMDLTFGEQQYAYLYINDFLEIFNRILKSNVKSGIYNISSENVIKIKTLVEKIRDLIAPNFKLNFGALEYRSQQSMFIQGSMDKLKSQIGDFEFTKFDIAINNTIRYYLNRT